jgi:hypothetical protein
VLLVQLEPLRSQDLTTIVEATPIELDIVGREARAHRRRHRIRHGQVAKQIRPTVSAETSILYFNNSIDIGLRAGPNSKSRIVFLKFIGKADLDRSESSRRRRVPAVRSGSCSGRSHGGEDHPALPSSMTLIAGAIDARISPTKVNALATSKPIEWFANTLIATVLYRFEGGGRRVYPGFLQLTAFMSMNLSRHAEMARS